MMYDLVNNKRYQNENKCCHPASACTHDFSSYYKSITTMNTLVISNSYYQTMFQFQICITIDKLSVNTD